MEEGAGGDGGGGEVSERNDAKMRRVRGKQELLGLLLERVRDTSAHVRSRVLATWAWLCQQKAVPLGHWNAVTQLAVGRLQDKSSIVRKSALQVREQAGGYRGVRASAVHRHLTHHTLWSLRACCSHVL